MEELPANAIINKKLTGCGATTLAIKQPGDTIIAVPYTALIRNKTVQDTENVLLGLYGGGDDYKSEMSSYLESHDVVKMMTTYDSLPKVCQLLQELGRNPYEMFLVVDE